ncbi:phosphonate ABC transporter, permease protein PhnE, partial [Cribrihabitans sp. XS_ASV171]
MTATDMAPDTLKARADALFRRKRLMNFGLPALVVLYLIYVFFAFDVPGLWERASLENGRTLIRDSYSYKTHVTRDNSDASVSVAIEGERKGE